MLSDEHDEVLETTESIVSKLLYHMGLQAQVSAHYGEPRDERRPIMVDVRGSDLGILIGRRGQTLDAFQYVAALMVGKGTGQFIHCCGCRGTFYTPNANFVSWRSEWQSRCSRLVAATLSPCVGRTPHHPHGA
jgi:predicted RNA-binding protein YlqC (UPF0109 family)